MRMISFLIVLFSILNVYGFNIPSVGPIRSLRLCQSLKAVDLQSLQSNIVRTLTNEFQLKTTDYTDVYRVKSWSVGNYEGASEWLDETKGSKLTGISSSSYFGRNSASISISGWLGPTSSVPHFTLSASEEGNGLIHFAADYIVRGSQPIGNDMSYFSTYYSNPDILKKYEGIYTKGKPVFSNNPLNFYERVLQSPNAISVYVDSAEVVSSFSVDFVNQWIQWIREATPVETRSRGAMNSRDDKLRQFFYASNFHKTQLLFPGDKEFAKQLAAGWTGPISEAYVGGGS